MGRRQHFSRGIFHGSEFPPEHYLKAPLIHVGSWDSALASVDPQNKRSIPDEWGDTPHSDYEKKVTAFDVSPTASVHRVTVPDKIANEAHAHFLRQQNLPVPESVAASRSFHGKDHPLVKTALKALNAGKIVPYTNDYEMARDSDGFAVETYNEDGTVDEGPEISYMVPNPKLNLRQFK